MKAIGYVKLFCLTSLLCIAALLAAALLPQAGIAANISRSLPGLVNEGLYPQRRAHDRATKLDNLTDSLIMMEVLGMNSSDLGTVFSNPLYLYKGDPLESLVHYAENPELEPNGQYVRYWMGFRASLRLLFSFFTYSQIRRLNLLALSALAALAMFSVAKRVNVASALGLGICLLLMRPLIVARSFQFSTCFYIALAALPLVPWAAQRRERFGGFFLVLGMLTQYLDFYTVPVLTLCLPLLYYFALRIAAGEEPRLRELAAAFLAWMGGYVLFWVEKLLLSTLFTETNGFANGFSEFLYWMKREPDANSNKLLALWKKVGTTVCPNREMSLLLPGLLALLLAYALLKLRRGKLTVKRLGNSALAATALLPLAWMCAAATPTANHAFFQYRSLAATFWGLCLLVTAGAEGCRLRLPARKEE